MDIIGTDNDTSNNTYSVSWVPDTEHFYLRAISYDIHENYAISEVFSDFHVDGWGPETPLTLQATLDLTHTPRATVMGYLWDRMVEGQTSHVDYVVLWHYDVSSDTMTLVEEDGQVVKIPVIDYQFQYDIDLEVITGATGDISYSFFAQGYDHVGNEGNMSDAAIWTNTDLPDNLRVISPSSIRDIPLKHKLNETDDYLDELRSITVTFLSTEQDFMNYMLTRAGQLTNSSEAAVLGLPDGTKFLNGYFNVEVPPQFTNFEAQVTIEFHISEYSQLGPSTMEILEGIRLVARHMGDSGFKILDLIGGQPQPIDMEKGLFRVQARVNRFSDFALVIAQPDLTVEEIIFGANPAIMGQTINIYAVVKCGGDFPKQVENVFAKVFSIDEIGNQRYLGEMEFGTIDPTYDYDPDYPWKGVGEKRATLQWTVSSDLEEEPMQSLTVMVLADPDGYVKELDEENNEKTTTLDVPNPEYQIPIPSITEPMDGATVTGSVMIKGIIPETTVGKIYQPFGNNDFAWHIEKVDPEAVSVYSVNYVLFDQDGGKVVVGAGCVKDIYGLNFDDESTNISYQDNDRDGKISAGDVFLVKNIVNGGIVTDGQSLELEIGKVERVEISINGGEWTTVNGTDSWSYDWNSREVENDGYKIEVRAFDGSDYSEIDRINIHVNNKGGDGGDSGLPLFDKFGPMPLIGYIAIVVVVALSAIVTMNKRKDQRKDGVTPGAFPSQQPQTAPFPPSTTTQYQTQPNQQPPFSQQGPYQFQQPKPQTQYESPQPPESPPSQVPQQPQHQYQYGSPQPPQYPSSPAPQQLPHQEYGQATPHPQDAQIPMGSPQQSTTQMVSGWMCPRCGNRVDTKFEFCNACAFKREN